MTTTEGRTAHHAGAHTPTADTTNADRAAWARDCAFCARLYTTEGEFVLDARSAARRAPSHTETAAPADARPRYNGSAPQRSSRTVTPPTQAQYDFIKVLIAERDTTPLEPIVRANRSAAVAGSFSKTQATEFIKQLKLMPKKSAEATAPAEAPVRKPWPKVEQGYYALTIDQLPGAEFKNQINFFFVARPTTGNYAGRTFVKLMASDDKYPVYGDKARFVLEAIAADPEAAGRLFAKETNHCYRCHRTLTDDESRARGLGPTCAGK